jgi:hypothetical protein
VRRQRIKIPAVVQRQMTADEAKRADDHVDRLADRDAPRA